MKCQNQDEDNACLKCFSSARDRDCNIEGCTSAEYFLLQLSLLQNSSQLTAATVVNERERIRICILALHDQHNTSLCCHVQLAFSDVCRIVLCVCVYPHRVPRGESTMWKEIGADRMGCVLDV